MLLMAIVMAMLSIGSINQSGKNRELEKQVGELQDALKQANAENQRLDEELQKNQLLLETLSQSIDQEISEEEEARKESSDDKCVYLTFDDGPHENTDKILDILDTYSVKATFFVNGRESADNIATYKRIAEEGHVIANHTYSHSYEDIYASTEAFMDDVYKLEEMLLEKAEITMPKIVRFPGGSNNLMAEPDVLQEIKDELTSQGYRYFDWNVSGEDAVRKDVTAKEIYDEVIRTTKGKENPVILLHSANLAGGTIEALPDILHYYLKQGYVFCTLDKEDAPQVVLSLISKE